MICPTKTERIVWLTCCNNIINNIIHKLFAITKPIMPITKALDTCLASQLCLLFTHNRQTKVIKAQISWYMWLIVSTILFSCSGNVCPFSKTFTPPLIILWKWVILRKIQCDYSRIITIHMFSC